MWEQFVRGEVSDDSFHLSDGDLFQPALESTPASHASIGLGPMPLAAWDHFKASIALLSSRHSPSLNTTFTLNGSALSKESPR